MLKARSANCTGKSKRRPFGMGVNDIHGLSHTHMANDRRYIATATDCPWLSCLALKKQKTTSYAGGNKDL